MYAWPSHEQYVFLQAVFGDQRANVAQVKSRSLFLLLLLLFLLVGCGCGCCCSYFSYFVSSSFYYYYFLFLIILLIILIFLHVLVIIVVLLVIVALLLIVGIVVLVSQITIFLEWPLCLLFNPSFSLQVPSTDPPSLSSFRQVLVGAATGTESTKWFIISLYIQRLISKVIHPYSHHDGHDPHSRWWPTGITGIIYIYIYINYINSFPQWPIMTHTYSCS